MQTAQYWWKHLIWHPIDVADRVLLLVGAVLGYFGRSNPEMGIDLVWQIPAGTMGLFLLWRLVNLPTRYLNDVRQAREGTSPPTLDSLKAELVIQQQIFEEIRKELKSLKQERKLTRKELRNLQENIVRLKGEVSSLRGDPLKLNSGRSH